MRLPRRVWPLLEAARSAVSRVQRWPMPPRGFAAREIAPLPRGLVQPDRTSCGSSVLVAMRLLAGAEVGAFGDAALAARRRTNGWRDGRGHLQLPWPASQGTRPAALIRDLGGGWRNRVVDPRRRGAAYDVIVAWVRSGRAVPLYIGEGSWMQHIVLVVGAHERELHIYDPACGETVTRTRAQFVTAHLDVAGWDQPWLVILPRG